MIKLAATSCNPQMNLLRTHNTGEKSDCERKHSRSRLGCTAAKEYGKEKREEEGTPSSFPFPSSFAYAWRRGWGVQHILQHAATRVTMRLRHAYSALNTRGVQDERLKV